MLRMRNMRNARRHSFLFFFPIVLIFALTLALIPSQADAQVRGVTNGTRVQGIVDEILYGEDEDTQITIDKTAGTVLVTQDVCRQVLIPHVPDGSVDHHAQNEGVAAADLIPLDGGFQLPENFTVSLDAFLPGEDGEFITDDDIDGDVVSDQGLLDIAVNPTTNDIYLNGHKFDAAERTTLQQLCLERSKEGVGKPSTQK